MQSIFKNFLFKALVACLPFLQTSFFVANAQRQVVSLNGEWVFTDPDSASTATVVVPSSWDCFKSAYNLTANVKTCSYEKTVSVTEYQGKRLLLNFEGVNKTAKVSVDNVEVGTHVGGFTAFYMDITDQCAGKQEVTIKVDVTNMDFNTMPVNSDFTHFAGIYRDVNLVVVNPTLSVSNLDYGSKGLYLKTSVDPATGLVNYSASLKVDYKFPENERSCFQIKHVLKDQAGNIVYDNTFSVDTIGSATAEEYELEGTSFKAHLWQGTQDPYLYTAEVSLMDSKGNVVDEVSQRIGFRKCEVRDGVFYLNGEEYPLHGVGMHQEFGALTNATTDEQKSADINTVLEMGANALRTCHYPHDQYIYDLCDEKGILVWNEIPFYLVMLETDTFKDNCTRSALEMVKQGYNHPSIMIWGIENEVNVYPSYQKYYPTQASVKQLGAFVKELASTVKDTDPSRWVGEAEIDNDSYAQETAGWTTSDSGIDVVGFNLYNGWYSSINGATQKNKINRIQSVLNTKLKKYEGYFNAASSKSTSYVLTEYGAGANVEQHADLDENFKWGGTDANQGYTTTGSFHPEEYQAYVHEGMLMSIYGDAQNKVKKAPIWCAFAWAMFDFSCYRNEGGTTRLNTKGLITADRQIKKDAFYLYKANWNKTDFFTHICSSRYTNRKDATISVKVYSNCDKVTLTVNGKNLGEGTCLQSGVYVWNNVTLYANNNEVEAIGTNADGKEYTDTCTTWTSENGQVVNIQSIAPDCNPDCGPAYDLMGRPSSGRRGLHVKHGKLVFEK